jgi:4'-phosphopantetheinyl transferase EntD
MTNPASLSSSFTDLFPPGAVATELRVRADPALLLPAERLHLGRSVPKRVQEFTAGRLCARRALAQFGMGDFALKVAEDRQPLWPVHLCGSITHTDGLCAAVVAPRSRLMSVGIDSEVVGHVNPDLWATICLPLEIAWLGSLPPTDRASAATLIFSAKEAFYKCQYPVNREAIGFHAVSIEPEDWGVARGGFTIRDARRGDESIRTPFPRSGQYLIHDEYVTAGIALLPADWAQ